MAYHHVEPGTVPIVVGAIYSRWPANSMYSSYSQYRLNLVNEGTGTAKLCSVQSKYVLYVSLAELSSPAGTLSGECKIAMPRGRIPELCLSRHSSTG